mmetsp:Transcript_2367/g.7838  ORF Transcript_2367/g.7838 Transcript_2367/m.7838 type:complete len:396 (-) Transcript_2367:2325-3512(-)|eukprot:scaffold1658_cov115-Isochrysis_galbana.AAC.13
MDAIERGVGFLQVLQQLGRGGALERGRVIVGLAHQVEEDLVDLVKLLVLVGQLPLDVLRLEDGLEVHPAALHGQPLVERVREEPQLPVPFVDALLKRADEARAKDGLNQHLRLLEHSQHVVDPAQDEDVLLFLVHMDDQLQPLPQALHLGQQLLQDLLLRGCGRDALDRLAVLVDPQLEQVAEREALAAFDLRPDGLLDRLPVVLLERVIAHRHHHRHQSLEGVHLVLEQRQHAVGLQALVALRHHLGVLGHLLLHQLGVELAKGCGVPHLHLLAPVGDAVPQVALEPEVGLQGLHLVVPGHRHLQHLLVLGVLGRVGLERAKLVVERRHQLERLGQLRLAVEQPGVLRLSEELRRPRPQLRHGRLDALGEVAGALLLARLDLRDQVRERSELRV